MPFQGSIIILKVFTFSHNGIGHHINHNITNKEKKKLLIRPTEVYFLISAYTEFLCRPTLGKRKQCYYGRFQNCLAAHGPCGCLHSPVEVNFIWSVIKIKVRINFKRKLLLNVSLRMTSSTLNAYLPHKVKTQYLHFRSRAEYFLSFCLWKFLKWWADDQTSSTTRGSITISNTCTYNLLVWKWFDDKIDIKWIYLLYFIIVDTAFLLCVADL